MSSIGPQLPPHLQKRKRTPVDDAPPERPPAKTLRPANDDEIDLDEESSDDGYGPSAPSAHPGVATPSQHGPAQPPSTTSPDVSTGAAGPTVPPPSNPDQLPLLDDDSDDGPAARIIGPSAPRPQIGPSLPPASLSTLPPTKPDSDSDSDSDDEYGPRLPSSTPQTNLSSLPAPSYTAAPPQPKRDDWMLAPPAAASGYRAPDPTKLKARKFASGRAANAESRAAGGAISSLWTETAQEKAARLRDAVLGRGGDDAAPHPKPAEASRASTAGGRAADEDKIRSFTEQTRGKSLYEEHQMRKKGGDDGKGTSRRGADEDEEDDPGKRAFSWEKDMKAGGTISHSQRRELLNRSADFGGRFQKGSYL